MEREAPGFIVPISRVKKYHNKPVCLLTNSNRHLRFPFGFGRTAHSKGPLEGNMYLRFLPSNHTVLEMLTAGNTDNSTKLTGIGHFFFPSVFPGKLYQAMARSTGNGSRVEGIGFLPKILTDGLHATLWKIHRKTIIAFFSTPKGYLFTRNGKLIFGSPNPFIRNQRTSLHRCLKRGSRPLFGNSFSRCKLNY